MRVPPHAVVALIATAALAASAAAGPALTKTATSAVGATQRVRLEFPVGDLHVAPATDGRVHVTLSLRCDDDRRDCEERARGIEPVTVSRSSELLVKLDGWPAGWNPLGLHLETTVQVPHGHALDVSLGLGSLDVKGLRGDVSAQVGVGDALVNQGRGTVRRVRLESGVGNATLRRGDETIGGSGVVGHVVDWDGGRGKAVVRVKVGVGRIEVGLD